MLRRALLAIGLAGMVAVVLRARGSGRRAAPAGRWRELSGPELRVSPTPGPSLVAAVRPCRSRGGADARRGDRRRRGRHPARPSARSRTTRATGCCSRDEQADRLAAVVESLGSPAQDRPVAVRRAGRRRRRRARRPSRDPPRAPARAFLAARIPVVSVSDAIDDVRALLDLDPEARERGVPVVVGAGFAPGLSCVLARPRGRPLRRGHRDPRGPRRRRRARMLRTSSTQRSPAPPSTGATARGSGDRVAPGASCAGSRIRSAAVTATAPRSADPLLLVPAFDGRASG